MNTGQIIKILRKEKGLTQVELGNLLGVKKTSVQKYENGSIQNLKISTLKSLCDIFKVSPWIILFPEEIKSYGIDIEKDISQMFEKDRNAAIFRKYFTLNEYGRNKVDAYIQDLLDTDKYHT